MKKSKTLSKLGRDCEINKKMSVIEKSDYCAGTRRKE